MAITNLQVVTGYYDNLGTPSIESAVTAQLAAGWIPQGAPVLTDVYGQVTQSMVKSTNLSATAYTIATGATPMAPDATWNTLGNPTWIESGRYLQAYSKGDQVSAEVDLVNQVIGVLPIANGGTGATDAATVWTNIGGGDVGKLDTINLTTDVTEVLPVTSGGTGVSTQSELWGAVRPVGETLLSSNPVSPLGATTKRWVEEYVKDVRSNTVMYVSDYGVTGSGNETSKIRDAHTTANISGATLVYDVASVTLDGRANIPVKSSVDFNGCVITPVYTGTPDYNLTPTFSIEGNAAENVTSKVSLAGMRKGEMALYGSMTNYSRGTFWMDTADPLCKRQVSEATASYFKTTINRITKFGALQYPLEHNFTTSTGAVAYFRPDENSWLTISDCKINTSSLAAGVVFKINRSQVILNKTVVRQDNNVRVNNIRHLIYTGDGVSQILISNSSSEGMSSYDGNQGTYLIAGNYTCQLSISNVTAVQGWGAMGMNKTRDVLVTDSTLNRVDGHYHFYNVTIDNVNFHEFGLFIGTGGGSVKLTNINKYIGVQTDFFNTSNTSSDKSRLSVVYMRDDYGNYFDGDISVNSVSITLGREISFSTASENFPAVVSVVSFNSGVPYGSSSPSSDADYGYTSSVPWANSVLIDNVVLNITNEGMFSSWITLVGVNYNAKFVLPAVVFPASVTVRNMRYNKYPQMAKITPLVLPNLLYTEGSFLSPNNRAIWNSKIEFDNIQSGFVTSRVVLGNGVGATSLDAMYTQTEISNFPSPALVPSISAKSFYGFAGRFNIPGQLDLTNSHILAVADSSGGRNASSWITIKDCTVYPLPLSGGTTSNLPRATWHDCRFINSTVAPTLTDYDAIKGCTFENGNTPIGVTSAVAFSGNVGDTSSRLQ